MNGSQAPNAPAVYGSLGVQSANNTPGGRVAYSLGKTPDGMLWLHGGALGAGAYGFGDLWRLDPANGEWTWMGGSSTANPPPLNGTLCLPQGTNDPGERLTNPTWQTPDGRMWRFGIMSSSGFLPNNYDRSDLWAFCPTTMEWTWVHGPATNNVPGNWGTIGVSSPTNLPNGRQMASAWTALNGDLFYFGGAPLGAFATCGDLWRFTPDPSCGACGTTAVQDDIEPTAFSTAPNPLENGPLRLTLPVGHWSIDVLDKLARRVISTTAKGNTDLEFGSLPNGSYMVVARDGDVQHTARVLLAR